MTDDRIARFDERQAELSAMTDEQLKERFWALSEQLMDPVVELARTHTSSSIERSVLLRMGIDSVSTHGVVDRVTEAGLLGKGAGHCVLKLAYELEIGVREAAQLIISDPNALDGLFDAAPTPRRAFVDEPGDGAGADPEAPDADSEVSETPDQADQEELAQEPHVGEQGVPADPGQHPDADTADHDGEAPAAEHDGEPAAAPVAATADAAAVEAVTAKVKAAAEAQADEDAVPPADGRLAPEADVELDAAAAQTPADAVSAADDAASQPGQPDANPTPVADPKQDPEAAKGPDATPHQQRPEKEKAEAAEPQEQKPAAPKQHDSSTIAAGDHDSSSLKPEGHDDSTIAPRDDSAKEA